MKKILTILVLSFFIISNSFAGSDEELNLSKKSKPVKDCFEPINRITFAVNMGLDKVIFKPVAMGYRVLPSPVRAGVSNAGICGTCRRTRRRRGSSDLAAQAASCWLDALIARACCIS